MLNRFTDPVFQALDSNGDPLPGAKLTFYVAGTTTLQDTFSDAAHTTANANPVIANGNGRFGEIFLAFQDYKVELKTSADVVVWTRDDVGGTWPAQSEVSFTGDGSTTSFALGANARTDNNVLVTVDGAVIPTDEYSVVGTNAVFTTAPPDEAAVVLRILGAGAPGTDGVDGERWFTGTGTPSSGTGSDGDFYLDTANGDVFEKTSGSWGSSIMNLTGPTGGIAASLFDANTILAANVDDTPLAVTVAEQRLLGRITGGNITALTGAQILTLLGVETGATADQSDGEIKTAYENNADTNEFSDAEQTKLAGIETAATADQTGTEIATALGGETLVDVTTKDIAGTLITHATPGTTEEIDYAAGDYHLVTLDANLTYTLANFQPVSVLTIQFVQDSTAWTLTHPAALDWGAAGVPVMPTASGARLIIVLSTKDGGTVVDAVKFTSD